MLDTDSPWWKYMPVDRLRDLLAELPEDAYYITPNRVGNLSVLDVDLQMKWVIEIGNEAIENYEDME